MRPLVQMGPETSPGILIKTVFEGGYEDYCALNVMTPQAVPKISSASWILRTTYDRLEDFRAELALLTSSPRKMYRQR